MARYRKVTIKNIHKLPIDKRAFCKLIRYYYKGCNNVQINFDNRISAWGMHRYESQTKTHEIVLSPLWCSFEQKTWTNKDFDGLTGTINLTMLNDFDTRCRVICTILHELKHAMQCDENPIRYAKCQDDRHPVITNAYLKYQLSFLEAEAEGWALLHFNRALYRYERWCNERVEI